jgi:hypothetical protein
VNAGTPIRWFPSCPLISRPYSGPCLSPIDATYWCVLLVPTILKANVRLLAMIIRDGQSRDRPSRAGTMCEDLEENDLPRDCGGGLNGGNMPSDQHGGLTNCCVSPALVARPGSNFARPFSCGDGHLTPSQGQSVRYSCPNGEDGKT